MVVYDENDQEYFLESSKNTWAAGEWYFIAATYDGNALKLFVNGKVEEQSSVSFKKSDRDEHLRFGRSAFSDDYYFDGAISEARAYNHALTSQEVQYLYTASQRGRQVTSSKSS